MKTFVKYLALTAVVLLIAASASAQSANKMAANVGSSVPATLMRGTGKVAVVMVGSAAKSAWAVTKFSAKHVAKPIAKTIFLKAAPKLTVYALKKTPVLAKKLTPTAIKLALL